MKRYVHNAVACCLLMLCCCHAPTHARAKAEAEQRWNHVRARVKYQLAQQQFDSHFFDDSIRAAHESLALDPAQHDVYVLLAKANLELGRPASAEEALRVAAGANLESPTLSYLTGLIHEQRGELEAAGHAYARARKVAPHNVDFLIAKAECLVATGHAAVALALLDANADRVDDDGSVAALSGHVAELLGDHEDAVRRYRRALRSGAKSTVVAEELGLLLIRLARYEEALAVLLGISTDGGGVARSPMVRRAVGRCYLMLDRPGATVEVLNDYARSAPQDTSIQLLVAKAAVATGDLLSAMNALDRVSRHDPRNQEAALLRAVVQWRRGDLPEATVSLRDLLARSPDDTDVHCLLAEMLLDQNDPEAAREHFERAIQINPRCQWALQGLHLPG